MIVVIVDISFIVLVVAPIVIMMIAIIIIIMITSGAILVDPAQTRTGARTLARCVREIRSCS